MSHNECLMRIVLATVHKDFEQLSSGEYCVNHLIESVFLNAINSIVSDLIDTRFMRNACYDSFSFKGKSIIRR